MLELLLVWLLVLVSHHKHACVVDLGLMVGLLLELLLEHELLFGTKIEWILLV